MTGGGSHGQRGQSRAGRLEPWGEVEGAWAGLPGSAWRTSRAVLQATSPVPCPVNPANLWSVVRTLLWAGDPGLTLARVLQQGNVGTQASEPLELQSARCHWGWCSGPHRGEAVTGNVLEGPACARGSPVLASPLWPCWSCRLPHTPRPPPCPCVLPRGLCPLRQQRTAFSGGHWHSAGGGGLTRDIGKGGRGPGEGQRKAYFIFCPPMSCGHNGE